MLQRGKIGAKKHLKIMLKKTVNAFLIELKHFSLRVYPNQMCGAFAAISL